MSENRVKARDVLRAMAYPECHEEVTRNGEAQPCEKWAVAVRIDPEEGSPYPVCKRHASRDGLIPLVMLLSAFKNPDATIRRRDA